MKLRNKKTGVKGDFQFLTSDNAIKLWSCNNNYENYCYESLSEFNKDWEDYKPVEPIIEDEKTRKVFREWADLIGAKQFITTHCWDYCNKTTIFQSTDILTKPTIELPGHIGNDAETYTREGLCGEEE